MWCRRASNKPEATASKADSPDAQREAVEASSPRGLRGASLVAGLLGSAAAFVVLGGMAAIGASAAEMEASDLTCPDLADCEGLPGFVQKPTLAHKPSEPSFLGVHEGPRPDAVEILQKSYRAVFKTGNRNSAAHLWSTHLLEQSASKSAIDLENLFTAFCGISASLIVPISAESRWRLTLPTVTGDQRTGFMYYCTGCRGWPCLCDALEHLKVDTKTVALADGTQKQYHFAVIGNPCETPEMSQKLQAPMKDRSYGDRQVTLQMAAPELTCAGSVLKGATLSDNGHVIVAMFFENVPELQAQEQERFGEQCTKRGVNVGMGPIFRTLASVNQI